MVDKVQDIRPTAKPAKPKRLYGAARAPEPASIITATADKLGLTMPALARAIGLSDSGLYDYVKNGVCPRYVALAIMQIEAQQPKVEDDKSRTWLMREQGGTLTLTELSQEPEQLSLGGKNYVAFPLGELK